jgi:hypothetical protein
MNLVSLLVLPAMITLESDDNDARFAVAGVALIVLIGAIVWSSRKVESLAGTPTTATTPVGAVSGH